MNLESQIVSLNLAGKLKHLNVQQESLFYWSVPKRNFDVPIIYYAAKNLQLPDDDYYESYSAFTLSELAELLPDSCSFQKDTSGRVTYWCDLKDIKGNNLTFVTTSLADAAAKMLIHLIENKLI